MIRIVWFRIEIKLLSSTMKAIRSLLSLQIFHPFKFIQRKLDVEREWLWVKSQLRPHKYLVLCGVAVLGIPFYKDQLLELKHYANQRLAARLGSMEQTPEEYQRFSRRLIGDIVNQDNIKNELALLVQRLLEQQIVLDSL